MATKAINTVLNLRDNFSSKIKQTTKNTKESTRHLQKLGNQVKAFKNTAVSGFASAAKGAAGMAIGFTVAFAGIHKLGEFLNDSAGEAKTLGEQQTKLQTIMKNTKGVTDASINSLVDFANAQESVGVVGVDVALAGAQQMATFQLQASTIKTLVPAMNDLLAQQKGVNTSTSDGVSVGNLFGKVMNGQTGALSKLGINFTKTQEKVLKFGNESQKAATLAEVLKMNVGGVNAALAKTDEGKIKQSELALAGLKVEVGKVVMKVKAQSTLLLAKTLPTILKAVLATFSWFKKGIDYVTPYLKALGGVALRIFDSIKHWGMSAFTKIKQVISDNKPTIDAVKVAVSDLGAKLVKLKNNFVNAFKGGSPSISWIKDKGIPAVVNGIFKVIHVATNLYNYFRKNWSKFEPVIYGIAGAIAAYKIGVTAAVTATKIWKGVTTALSVAQAVLNGTLALSPMGWIAIAIGAVITAGVLLWKNWDTVKLKAQQLWGSVTSVWSNIKSSITNAVTGVSTWLNSFPLGQTFLETVRGMIDSVKQMFNGFITFFKSVFKGDWEGAWKGIVEVFRGQFNMIKTYAKAPINSVIDMINGVIERVNKISVDIPDWMGGGHFGVSIPTIPKFALGTSYFRGGLAQINERGGELVNLPNGSQVIPADKTDRMLNKQSGPIEVKIIIEGNVIGNDEFLNHMGSAIVNKLKLALSNQ